MAMWSKRVMAGRKEFSDRPDGKSCVETSGQRLIVAVSRHQVILDRGQCVYGGYVSYVKCIDRMSLQKVDMHWLVRKR
jgi:hypothetical protein